MTEQTAIPCGAFELVEPIGEGGMAEVWRGRHHRQGVEVAVKVMDVEAFGDVEGVSAFRREVQAHAGFDHPGIATVFDYGEIDEDAVEASDGRLEAGLPYLVMEYAPDGTLRDAPLPSSWSEARAVLVRLLDALAHAHARGVIHRDLKPSNVLRFPAAEEAERLRLTDFGIAHAADRVRDRGTEDVEYRAAGTPHYAPPEQLRGRWRRFGPWTDLYQLGCMAYELVCGRVPFPRDSYAALLTAHITDPRPELEPRFPVPERLGGWVARAMAKDPAGRFRRAADAARRLAGLEFETLEASGSEKSDVNLARAETRLPDPDSESPAEDAGDDSAADQTFDAERVAGGETIPEAMATTKIAPTLALPSNELDREVPEAGENVGPVQSMAVPEVESVPQTWRSADQSGGASSTPEDRGGARPSRFVDVGLGVFGLREIPFVDRDAERERLWRALRGVAAQQSPRAVLLEGLSGTGKSRLAEWAARRGHELGACEVLKATHGRQGGPGHGLEGMLERWLQSWNLDRGDVHELIGDRLEPYRTEDDEVGDLAAGLTELVRPTDAGAESIEGPPYQLAGSRHRFALIGRWLSALATHRPVVVWLDDLQRSGRTAGLVEFLFGRDSQVPTLCVGTIQTGDPAEDPTAVSRLEDLRGHHHVETLELEGLSPDDQQTLVARMLPLAPRLVEEVRDRTEGHPLFAVQLVGQWVERELLAPTEQGFDLEETPDEALPGDLRAIWERRLEKALAGLAADRRREAWRALEIAATLGREVAGDEWRAACRQGGLKPPRRLVDDQLVARGLVDPRSRGWSFVHGMLAESLRDRADRAGRLGAHHRSCARALEELYAESTVEIFLRRADHREAAGDLASAIEALGEAASLGNDRIGDHSRERQLLERRRDLMDASGLPESDPRRADNRIRIAGACRLTGDADRAWRLAESVRECAEKQGWLQILARAERELGALEDRRGRDYERAERHLRRAEGVSRREDDAKGLARCLLTRGVVAYRQGNYQQAREHYQKAREGFHGIGEEGWALQSQLWIAWCLLGQGDLEGASREARAIRKTARHQGLLHVQAEAANLMGDAERFLGRPEQAVDAYRLALRVHRSAGRDTTVLEANLVGALVGARQFEKLASRLPELEDDIRRSGDERLTLPVALSRAACAAGDRRWNQWRSELQTLRSALREYDYRTRDLPWLAEQCAEICLDGDATEEAREVYRLAGELWQDLDADEEARRVTDLLEELDT